MPPALPELASAAEGNRSEADGSGSSVRLGKDPGSGGMPGEHARSGSAHGTIASALSEASVARTYGRLAPAYDVLFGKVLEPGRKRMAEKVHALKPGSLLEVGCGTGLALESYPTTCKIVGIDLSRDMLERARRRAARLSAHQITVECMNAECTSFADGSFDCVTVPYVLSVTPRPHALVREICRVCKPGGTILVLNHFTGSKFWWLMERLCKPVAMHVGFRSDFKYGEHILVHDWDVLSSEPVNLFGLSRLVVLRNRC